MTSAGYSGTPLQRKLGIKAGHRVALLGAPRGFALDLPEDSTMVRSLRGRKPLDVVLLFSMSAAHLRKRFRPVARRLHPAGGLWVAWPKKASGVATDLGFDVVQKTGLRTGLVDNKICAVDETWSGLRFVVCLKDR